MPSWGLRPIEHVRRIFTHTRRGGKVWIQSSVHPESYKAAKELLSLTGFTDSDIGTEKIKELQVKAEKAGLEKLARQLGVGLPTLKDIISELIRPGRDMRDDLPSPLLRSDILDISDLKEGMDA